MVGVVRSVEAGEAGESAPPPERLVCLAQLMASSPSLAAHSLEQCTARMDELARQVAARMGINYPAAKPHKAGRVSGRRVSARRAAGTAR